MPVLFDHSRATTDPAVAPTPAQYRRKADLATRIGAALEIGLINNMPDAALQATERQFIRLLNAAAGHGLVRLHFFSPPSATRSPEATARIQAVYTDIATLGRSRLDGLIVTGTEPRTEQLPHEPLWRALTEIVDWAETNTLSTIWSCLAAHVAVLHLDGIARRRLDEKCSGVFDCTKALDHPLVDGLSWPVKMPHSRYNGLDEGDLSAQGYRVLTRAGTAGIDIFTKQWRSLFVFFQGHPEYDAWSLQREYRRDVGRFLGGERDTYPVMPTDYFDTQTAAALEAFRGRALAERDPALIADCPDLTLQPSVVTAPRAAATAIFRNWLGYLASRKAA